MRSKELFITADKAPAFAERFTEFGHAVLESISDPLYGDDGKMQMNVVTQTRDIQGKTSRVLFAFEDVTLMKLKEGLYEAFQVISALKIEFQDGKVCVDFHAPDTESDFVIHARSLRCTLESRC
jgi:hypothetical protein